MGAWTRFGETLKTSNTNLTSGPSYGGRSVERLITGMVAKVGSGYSAVFWLIDGGNGSIVQLTSYERQGTLAQLWSPGMSIIARRFVGQLVELARDPEPALDQRVAVAALQNRQPPRKRHIRKGDPYVFPRLGIGRSGWGDVPSIGQYGYGPFLGGKVFADVLVMYDQVEKRVNSLNVLALYELKVWIFFGQGGVGYIGSASRGNRYSGWWWYRNSYREKCPSEARFGNQLREQRRPAQLCSEPHFWFQDARQALETYRLVCYPGSGKSSRFKIAV